MKYNKLSKSDINDLATLVGKHNLFTENIDIEGYSYDESPLAERYYPKVVVKPNDSVTIARVLSFANEKKIPVIPRGAGTGVSGGAIPIHNGIVLSLEKMTRILEIDDKNFVAVVEAGLTLANLRTELEKYNLVYPLYPGELNATIGGNVATNAGGMNAVKYGVTRHHILGLEIVLPNGGIIQSGGKYVKNTTAYDLTQLVIGSEGTLAVVTKIILKLSSHKQTREVLLLPFTGLHNAIDAVPEILKLPITPVGLEFMEKDIINIVENYMGWEMPHHEYPAFLMIIMEAETPEVIMDYFQQVNAICREFGAIEGLIPDSERAKRRLLQMREKFYPSIKNYAKMELIDAVVPRSEIARYMNKVKELSRLYNIPIIGYGHAGDGNVHLHILCLGVTEIEWQNKLPELIKKIYQIAISFGGAISGEHGIGCTKKKYLPMQFNEDYIRTLKAIKKALDPNNILNPGKIIDLYD
ncbi:MAG: FAD-binding oxidoreductase [Dehalococcoidales bacterium]|nr:FAD-binding oxidoreductase [Dehalococcoidales bacterium]